MEQNRWEYDSRSAVAKFTVLLRNPKMYYNIQKVPPFVSIEDKINPVNTLPLYFKSNIVIPSDSYFSK